MGHIPSVDICFTEDEETFLRDTYIFKSVISKNLHQSPLTSAVYDNTETLKFSAREEMYKLNAINDYSKQAIWDEMNDQYVQVGTLNQIETFHKFLMNDLYREEKSIDFTKAFLKGREIDKKYYIVPLKLAKDSENSDLTEYKVDRKLLEKVERISNLGYKAT